MEDLIYFCLEINLTIISYEAFIFLNRYDHLSDWISTVSALNY